MCLSVSILFLVLFLTYLSTEQLLQGFDENEFYLIRYSADNKLPIDATNPSKLTLQELTGDENQLWNMVEGDAPSLYYIVNKKTGKVLDFLDDFDRTLVINDKNATLNQQWMFMPNGSILNAGSSLYVDVYNGYDVPGTLVRLYARDATAQAQQFDFSYQVCEFKDLVYEF